MQKIVILTLFHCLIQTTLLFGQTKETLYQTVEQNITAQLEAFPQEKIHLHTDRDIYVPGEKIWFRAYVVDAVTHQYPTYSRFMYIELINIHDSLFSRVMIRLTDDGLFHGHLFLSESIPEGTYTLRAYTRYMGNLGDEYYFKKNIRIGSLKGGNKGNGGSRGSGVLGRSFDTSTALSAGPAQNDKGNGGNRGRIPDDFDVSFFPEGGNVVVGVMNKIAFKALNRNGYSIKIYGEIVNEQGGVITSVETFHAGMGVFGFSPEIDKRYYLKCRNETGVEKQFELPKPTLCAYALTATWQNKKMMIGLHQSDYHSESPCYLLAHCRGMVLYFDVWNNQTEYVVFSEEDLPAGIIQFILFDEQMNPLSERLVFSKNNYETKVDFQTDKAVYGKREKVIVSLREILSRTPSLSERGQGVRCSVAITDDNDIAIDSSTTIFSSLLLSSELKGYIENPAWYLQDNRMSSIALDYLMMTHGWRRYNIPKVTKGIMDYPLIPFQTSQKISGKVNSVVLFRPVANSEIVVLTNDGDFISVTTDETGAFQFDDFEYPDSTSFLLQAFGRRGSSRVELVVDEETFPKLIHAPQSPVFVEMDNYPSLHTNPFIKKAEQRSNFDDDMRLIHLDEVEVTATRIEKKEEPRLQFWANTKSDVTLRRDVIEKHAFRHIVEYLRLIPGVQIRGNSIVIRGESSLFNPQPPLILVDGTPFSSHTEDAALALSDIPVDIIESIDVFKSVSSAVFGGRGGSGVISITTRRSIENSNTKKEENPSCVLYTPLGYQKPAEFYSPKYETLESKHLTIPDYRTTIFWKPDVIISDTGEASFDFYTSDFPTTYSVVIEGLTTDGRIVRQVEKIRVQ